MSKESNPSNGSKENASDHSASSDSTSTSNSGGEKLVLEPSSQRIIATKNLALMAFMTVWGFGNVINGYATKGGVQAIFTWILMFLFYFVPYSLMVGEMGSAFKNEGGGVSSWVEKGFNKKLAYYAGWTYWVVHMPYISQKPLNCIIASCWAIWGDNRVSDFNVKYVQVVAICIFAVVVILALRGVTMVKTICSIAGVAGLIMSLLFIVMAISAPMFMDIKVNSLNIGFKNYLPTFNLKYFSSICILVFAVGGCEKISPYVNKMKDPVKGFPRGIIFMTIMVMFTAIVGTLALALMFDPLNPPEDLMTNGAYQAFQRLGNWYGVGDIFVKLYALSIVISNFGVMLLSIDAPLRIMIESTDPIYIPGKLRKINKYGSYCNGIYLMTVIVVILLIIPFFGIKQVDSMVKWLVKLNAVCMPMRYLWVFLAYIGLKNLEHNEAEYVFAKNKKIGKALGGWCFFLTAIACLMGVYTENSVRDTVINFLTPVILIGLGLIMPYLAAQERAKKGIEI